MKKELKKQEDLFLEDPEEVRKELLKFLKTHKVKSINHLSSQIPKLPKALGKELSQVSTRMEVLENYPSDTEYSCLLFFMEIGKFGFFLGRMHKKLLLLREKSQKK